MPSEPRTQSFATSFRPHTIAAEVRASIWLTLSVLVMLTIAKAVAPYAYVGPACLTLAAFWQLRAPLWRVERQGMGLKSLGLRTDSWRQDLRGAARMALIVLPLYAGGYHVWIMYGPQLTQTLGLSLKEPNAWAHPRCTDWPRNLDDLQDAFLWLGERGLTHTLGVALPEELFYRGYLQPLWQTFWPTRWRIDKTPFGLGTLAACAVFALGHFLGEWHLARLGPFLPSLLFAWQRARTGTIVGAVSLHAMCNIFAEVLAQRYVFGPSGR